MKNILLLLRVIIFIHHVPMMIHAQEWYTKDRSPRLNNTTEKNQALSFVINHIATQQTLANNTYDILKQYIGNDFAKSLCIDDIIAKKVKEQVSDAQLRENITKLLSACAHFTWFEVQEEIHRSQLTTIQGRKKELTEKIENCCLQLTPDKRE